MGDRQCQGKNPRQRRHSSRSTASHLRWQTVGRWAYPLGLQYSKRVDIALGVAAARWVWMLNEELIMSCGWLSGVQHPEDSSPFLSILYARLELVWTKTSQGAQNVQNLVFNTGRTVQSAVRTAVR